MLTTLTIEQIVEMARQAGFLYGKMGPSDMPFVTAIGHTFTVELEAFAKLVAEAAASKEREACAKTCEEFVMGSPFAAAIRARGQQ